MAIASGLDLVALFGFLIGLCVGSFAVTAALRWDHDPLGALKGRSACPRCARPLGPLDLIPVLSWLLARGKCRHCGEPIAAIYPIAELAAGLIGALSFWLVPMPGAAIAALLGWWLLLASLIDLRTLELPDSLTLILLIIGLGITVTSTWSWLGLTGLTTIDALVGVIAGFAIFWVINRAYKMWRKRDGLGLGDAKLLAAAGAWNGSLWLPETCLIASVVTLAAAILTGQLNDRFKALPFGPGLAFATWLVFLARQML